MLFQAKQGDEFDLLKTEGLWCLINLGRGEEAWVFGRLVEILPGEKSVESGTQPETREEKSEEPLWKKHSEKIILLSLLLFLVILIRKRRQLAEFTQKKLREISGYRREQPFRYDSKNPKDDRWEI